MTQNEENKPEDPLDALEQEYKKLKLENDKKDKIKELKAKIRKEKDRASPFKKTVKDLGEIFGPIFSK